jgi:hypothetical protein
VFASPRARIGKLIFLFILFAHLFGCYFFFIGKYQPSKTSWLTEFKVKDMEVSTHIHH